MKTVLYHKNCTDGFAAAYLFWQVALADQLHPIQYGEEVPYDILDGDELYVVDFSFKRDIMEELNEGHEKFVVLDHHKTAQEECKGLEYCTFDMNKSGAMLAFDYLFNRGYRYSEKIKTIIAYVQDRDLWNWDLPSSKEINAAIRSYPMDFYVWQDQLVERDINDLEVEGKAIERYRRQLIDYYINFARPVILNGIEGKIVPCNATDIYSEVAGEISGDTFGATFFELEDGKVTYSLRSRGDFDVSEIAKSYGGGGHKNAAGFRVDQKVH